MGSICIYILDVGEQVCVVGPRLLIIIIAATGHSTRAHSFYKGWTCSVVMLAAVWATRCCLGWLRASVRRVLWGWRVWRWLTTLHRLKAQLKPHDPLLLIVRTELASVSCELLYAISLKKTSEFSDFSLKFLVRLELPDEVAVAALVRTASCGIGPHLALLTLVTLSFIVFHRWRTGVVARGQRTRRFLMVLGCTNFVFRCLALRLHCVLLLLLLLLLRLLLFLLGWLSWWHFADDSLVAWLVVVLLVGLLFRVLATWWAILLLNGLRLCCWLWDRRYLLILGFRIAISFGL